MSELQQYNNPPIQQAPILSFDRGIQYALERKGYEYLSPSKDNSQHEDTTHFVKISHITYGREQESSDITLIDFQQLLSALASKTGHFVYVLENDPQKGASLYLGTSKAHDQEDDGFLRSTFEGIYSGSKLQSCSEDNTTPPPPAR